MGASSSVYAEVVNESLNKNVLDFINTNLTQQSTSVTTTQDMNLSNINYKNCLLNISQNSDVKVNVLQQATAQNALDLQTVITNALTSNLEASSEASTEFLSSPVATDSTTVTKAKNMIQTIVEKTITLETINQAITTINSSMSMDSKDITFDQCGYLSLYKEIGQAPPMSAIYKCDTSKPCNISQDMRASVLAQQIVNTTIAAVIKDESLSSLVSESKSTSSAENSGLTKLFSGQSGIVMAICCCVCLVILLLGAYAYFTRGKTT